MKECLCYIVFTKSGSWKKSEVLQRVFCQWIRVRTKEYGQGRKTYNNDVCFKGSTSSEYEVDYYDKLEEVIELQYHSQHNKVFLFKCYWYDTTNRGIRVDLHHGLVKINTKARLYNIDDVFFFTKQCQQVYYLCTIFFRKDHSCPGYSRWQQWIKCGRWCLLT